MLPPLSIEVEGDRISLDNGSAELAFVSHAHRDHLRGITKPKAILASKETRRLAGISKPSFSKSGLRLANAGHMLGAKQLVAEEDGGLTVYTGDFRLRDGLIEKGGEIVECDKLIIEATYARRIFRFPPLEEVYEDIARAVAVELGKGNSVMFPAYPLGKTQELVKLMNEYLSVAPVLYGESLRFSQLYKALGVKLDFIPYGEEGRGANVYIFPQSAVKRSLLMKLSFEKATPFKLFRATGWSVIYKLKAHKAFPLSDHADFYDIIRYIEESNAKEVIMFGGDGKEVIAHYKAKKNIRQV